MGWLKRILGSSVGQKAIVGLTGVALVLYLIIHMVENLQVFGPNEGVGINAWANTLHALPFLPIIEFGLFAVFVIHIGLTIKLARDNRAARATRYQSHGTKRDAKVRVAQSRTMAFSGIVVLGFLFLHVWDFRLQHETITEGIGLAATIKSNLQVWWRAVIYLLGVSLITWHMAHGISSASRSFGVNHSKWTPVIVKGGTVVAVLIGLGFAAIPVWALLTR
ncbi:MAG: succinate dehydrogenase cytochrome b subunit [Deltaproteobacteria bacterium]|nr:succinate dehydrogenase cytochrome b subunit [Deltaproteobacteria bacterium]MCB9786713.1 succinate dehydrogenase cytochrome b subunit [Deltaproteobacteria bacterium]